MVSTEAVRQFYNEGVEREWMRLEEHPMEFSITSHYLRKYIRPGDRVLDVGGGPGRYSLMLAEMGCEVTLLDLSEANVAFAREEAERRGLALRALAGDAREAAALVEGPFAHVLLMGPLYHLFDTADRARSVRACHALLKPSGTLFASIITQPAGMLYYLANDPALILDPGEEEYLRALEEDRPFTGYAFTDAHFMRVADLIPFMEAQGFETLHRVNCEGLCAIRRADILRQSEEVRSRWLALSLALCEREEFSGMAEHLLYVGKRNGIS